MFSWFPPKNGKYFEFVDKILSHRLDPCSLVVSNNVIVIHFKDTEKESETVKKKNGIAQI